MNHLHEFLIPLLGANCICFFMNTSGKEERSILSILLFWQDMCEDIYFALTKYGNHNILYHHCHTKSSIFSLYSLHKLYIYFFWIWANCLSKLIHILTDIYVPAILLRALSLRRPFWYAESFSLMFNASLCFDCVCLHIQIVNLK